MPRYRLAPQVAALERRQLLAIAIQIRFDDDTSHFFDTQAKKDLIQSVANELGASLNDHLAAITPSGSNTWSAQFINPTTGAPQSIDNLAVPSDTILVYVGGKALDGSEAGQNNDYTVTSSATPTPFEDMARSRGKAGVLANPPTAYAPWGGSISFDNLKTNWYFGEDLSQISSTQSDFKTVAEHELGHLLGVGTAPSWKDQASPAGFTGPASEAANGGKPIPLDAGLQHWEVGVSSDGAWTAMSPISNDGRRTMFSDLDYAALQDIGWSIAPFSRFQFASFINVSTTTYTVGNSNSVVPGDPIPEYNADGSSGSAVITVSRVGPVEQAASVHYETFEGIANSFTFSPTAVAGINYTPTSGTLNFAPGESTKTFTVPITDDHSGSPKALALALGNPSVGSGLGSIETATLVVNSHYAFEPAPTIPATSTTTVPPMMNPNTQPIPVLMPLLTNTTTTNPGSPGPVVLSAKAQSTRQSVNRILINFDGPLDQSHAQILTNFAVRLPGKPTKHNHSGGLPIAVLSALYDTNAHAVTLILGSGIKPGQTFQLRVKSGPGGLSNPSGNPLNSSTNMMTGADSILNLVGPKPTRSSRR